MKREYEEPQLEVVKFNVDTDVMTASVDTIGFDELQKQLLGTE